MNSPTIVCKYCHNAAVVKYGTFEGMQRYFCKSCQRKFADNDALPKMKTPVWVIASALSQYYDGKSLSTIQEYLNKRYGAVYAKTSIYNWVMRFSREANRQAGAFVPQVGDTWLASETTMVVGKHRIWLRDVIDATSAFLLDSSLMLKAETPDIGKIVNNVARHTSRAAARVIFTKSGDNEKKSEMVWYKSPADVYKNQIILEGEHDGAINRFALTLKTRRAVLRGYKNLETAHLLVATWQIHYNFFKSFTTMGHTPPAQTMAASPFKTWLDIVSQTVDNHTEPPRSLLSAKRVQTLPPEYVKELPLKGKYT
ncbi:MAG: hypothetical protein PHE50_06945 [Dehalococcoidales bacterium]|nr:hypothetical protein [Dehalococcoidales bacterium]